MNSVKTAINDFNYILGVMNSIDELGSVQYKDMDVDRVINICNEVCVDFKNITKDQLRIIKIHIQRVIDCDGLTDEIDKIEKSFQNAMYGLYCFTDNTKKKIQQPKKLYKLLNGDFIMLKDVRGVSLSEEIKHKGEVLNKPFVIVERFKFNKINIVFETDDEARRYVNTLGNIVNRKIDG